MVWKCIAKLPSLSEEDMLAAKLDGKDIAVFKLGDRYYAASNICSHQYALLTDGYLDGDVIECPLHQGRFHIPSGKALGDPVTEDLAVYPVRVENDEIQVEWPEA